MSLWLCNDSSNNNDNDNNNNNINNNNNNYNEINNNNNNYNHDNNDNNNTIRGNNILSLYNFPWKILSPGSLTFEDFLIDFSTVIITIICEVEAPRERWRLLLCK